MNLSLLSLIILWAISVYFAFLEGSKLNTKQKKKTKIKPTQDSLQIKRIKKAEKDFWHFDGTINTQNNDKI